MTAGLHGVFKYYNLARVALHEAKMRKQMSALQVCSPGGGGRRDGVPKIFSPLENSKLPFL